MIDGDWRRWIQSDVSAIDASRFNGVNLSPPAASMSKMILWYHEHPADSERALQADMLPRRRAEPERGRPAYHWLPREVVMAGTLLGCMVPELMAFEEGNSKFKKDTIHALAPAEKYLVAVKDDWEHYCDMFQPSRPNIVRPEYPYTLEMINEMLRMEEELEEKEKSKTEKRTGTGAGGMTEEQMASYQGPALIPAIEVNTHMALEPAKAVLRAYGNQERSPSPEKARDKNSRKAVQEWWREGEKMKRTLMNISGKPQLAH